MLTRWAIPIAGIDPATVERRHLHAVASAWVDNDHWASPKPWSQRALRTLDGIVAFDLTTLTEPVAQRMLDTIHAGDTFDLGGQHGTILTPPIPTATLAWPSPDHTTTVTAWTIRFLTPTSFGNRGRFTPWADPTTVMRSLIQRWNAYHPDPTAHLHDDPKAWNKIWISDIDGHNEVLTIAGATVSGYVGEIRYVCTEPPLANTIDALFRTAEYAGLGRYTAHGLGTVQIDPTPRPKSKTTLRRTRKPRSGELARDRP